MNREEAKYILQSDHLSGCDVESPQFRDALEMLQHDPELAAWFAQEQAIDAKLSESFRTFPVPPALKSQLLAGRKIVPLPVWWRQPAWIRAAAACMALLGTLAILLFRSPEPRQLAEFRSYVAETAATLDHLDLQTSDLDQIRLWLGGHSAPENFAIPGKLNGKSSVGCRVFQWNGQKVSLVCFELGNKKVAHLFVMDRSAPTNSPGESRPQFQTARNGIATASWSDARRIYIVALVAGEQDLKRLFL